MMISRDWTAVATTVKTFSFLIFWISATTVQAQSSLEVNGIIAMGDSLTAGTFHDGSGTFICTAQNNRTLSFAEQGECTGNGAANVGGWVPGLSTLQSTNVFNFGVAGDSTGEVLARIDAAMASQASTHVVVMAGTNDAIFGSVSEAIANIKLMIDKIEGAGKTAIIATLPPLFGSIVSSSDAQIQAINAQIEDLPEEFPSIEIADVYNLLAPAWAQHTSGDFIHIGNSGNSIIANEFSRAIEKELADRRAGRALIAPISILLDDEPEM